MLITCKPKEYSPRQHSSHSCRPERSHSLHLRCLCSHWWHRESSKSSVSILCCMWNGCILTWLGICKHMRQHRRRFPLQPLRYWSSQSQRSRSSCSSRMFPTHPWTRWMFGRCTQRSKLPKWRISFFFLLSSLYLNLNCLTDPSLCFNSSWLFLRFLLLVLYHWMFAQKF